MIGKITAWGSLEGILIVWKISLEDKNWEVRKYLYSPKHSETKPRTSTNLSMFIIFLVLIRRRDKSKCNLVRLIWDGRFSLFTIGTRRSAWAPDLLSTSRVKFYKTSSWKMHQKETMRWFHEEEGLSYSCRPVDWPTHIDFWHSGQHLPKLGDQ